METKEDIPSISYFDFDNKIYAVPYANGLRLALRCQTKI